ncbi:MAG: branched-chain amino acid ABC transporter permease [Acidimicrobiia bacterium]|nr:branched-chain amino acid ABC transporter permease [Acidimicrobiia bacterium]
MLRSISLTGRVKLGLAVAGLAFGVAAPYVFDRFVIGLISLALIAGLFAQSIDLLGGYAGLITLGHAGVSGTAAYGVGYMAAKVGAGFPAQIGMGLLAGMTASLIFGVMAMRSDGVYFIMVTLAQGMIVWGLSIRLFRITGAENGLTGIPRPPSVELYWQYYYLTLAVVVVSWILLGIIVNSPFGVSLKGLRESETRMRMLGYNTTGQKLYVFLLAGFFATLSGILLVYLNGFISPSTVILAASAIGVLEAILGGIGTLVGPMIGAFIIVFVQNVVSIYVARWPTLMGLLFVVVVLFARRGLVGAISDGWNRWLDRRGASTPQEPILTSSNQATGP